MKLIFFDLLGANEQIRLANPFFGIINGSNPNGDFSFIPAANFTAISFPLLNVG